MSALQRCIHAGDATSTTQNVTVVVCERVRGTYVGDGVRRRLVLEQQIDDEHVALLRRLVEGSVTHLQHATQRYMGPPIAAFKITRVRLSETRENRLAQA